LDEIRSQLVALFRAGAVGEKKYFAAAPGGSMIACPIVGHVFGLGIVLN
jgi:hypothetical protein